MLYIVKTTKLIIKRTTLLCGLLIAVVLALLPISAQAQCSTGWDASGRISIQQRGQSIPSTINVQQNGRVITGTADWTDLGHGNVPVTGTVDGTLDGDNFSVQIFWSNQQTGVYIAKVLPSGRLDGEGYEKHSPQSRTTWYSHEMLKCAPPPPPAPKPIKSSGKARSEPPAPPPPTPPFITASQPIVQPPFLPFASVYLGWDGGPDHPNVEIWLSMDNGAEIPAFSMNFAQPSPLWKQPKAGGEMQLQRYHHYKFVLKDAGKTLSTAAFVVP